MRKQLVVCSVLSLSLLIGCNGQEKQSQSLADDLEYMAEKNNEGNPEANQPKYSTNIENNYDQYELERARPLDKERALQQGPKKETPITDPDADSYNNVEYNRQSREIGKRLSQSRFIKAAQVTITNDRVIVAVEEPNRATYTRVNVSEKVRKALKEMPETKGKQIVIYTDEIYWDRMKDERSRPNQEEEMPKEEFGGEYNR